MTEEFGAMRPGEEVDSAKLHAYLQAHLQNTPWAAPDVTLVIEQFKGGHSNLTYLVRMADRQMVLRRPPKGANRVAGHDMGREYQVLAGLAPIYAKAPRPIIYCDDLEVLGVPFYLMERVAGVIIRNTAQPPPELNITDADMGRLAHAFVANLAAIHALDYSQTALKDLYRPGNFVERQVKGWLQRYAKAKTDDLPTVERVGSWLLEHTPADSGLSLIHNDYKYDNMVLAAHDLAHIQAVLDWEMATIGDPLLDFGSSLAYWLEPDDPAELLAVRESSTLWPGNPDRVQLVQQYALASGREPGEIVFYFVFGLFKLIVIAQQIYILYKLGYSTDERFGQFLAHIKALGHTAALAIEKNRIDKLG